MAFDITPYVDMSPKKVRELIRKGVIDFPTAGMCRGYAQANLVILPPEYAADFEEFAHKNPFPCPILEIIKGTPETHDMGEGGNICTDIPKYRIYENGVFTKEITDASEYWKEGYVGFLIGCSFSFEEALIREGIEIRHIAQGRNVPMFKTNIQTVPVGPFSGPMVCSMRPMTPENAKKAYRCRAKPIKNPRMKNICFHGKKYIQIGYSKIQSRMGNRTNSNGTSSKCPHVLWGKQNLSSISNPPLISLRNGFPFSSYILLNMPIIYPCTNIPEKTIFY